MLKHAEMDHQMGYKLSAPTFHPFDPLYMVTEICTLPLRWLGDIDMTRLAIELVC